jgi:hypothetical protein
MKAFAKRIGLVVFALLSVAGLYVLSSGPALKLFRAGYLSEYSVEIWEPVRLLRDSDGTVGKALTSYHLWWTGEEPDVYPPPPAVLPELQLTNHFTN